MPHFFTNEKDRPHHGQQRDYAGTRHGLPQYGQETADDAGRHRSTEKESFGQRPRRDS